MSGDTQIKQFIRTQPQIYLALSRDFKETSLLYGVINILQMTLLEQTRRDVYTERPLACVDKRVTLERL